MSYAYSLYWRKYLEHYTIERPHLCLDKLLFSDDEGWLTSCGPNWIEHQWGNHYSGNFWAATCEHINHLELTINKYQYWIRNIPLLNYGLELQQQGGGTIREAKLTSTTKKLYSNLIYPGEYSHQHLMDYSKIWDKAGRVKCRLGTIVICIIMILCLECTTRV